MRGYQIGDWLIHKHTQELFEITDYLSNTSHSGPDRCLLVRRIPYSTGHPHNIAINIIAEDFDLAPMARILYTQGNIQGAHNE